METKEKVMENWVFAIFQQSLNVKGPYTCHEGTQGHWRYNSTYS
jgi:hypothetical protein